MNDVSFGEWLRRRRKALDLTQEQLARQINCSTSALRKLEAQERRPSEQIVRQLAEVFKIPFDERATFLKFARGNLEVTLTGGLEDNPWHVPSRISLQSNLPASLTSFIGREKEQAEVHERINQYRLVTLVGSGGVGKTRLSLKVCEQLVREYANGVWLVELAPILDGLLVPRTTANAIGLHDEPQRPVIDMLSDYLREKQMLIILDNCEHLLDACAQLADTLLKRCPRLKIIATSREALGILGEAVYRVPSLQLPDLQELLGKFREYESVRLFEERAKLAQMNFSLTMENISSVAKICNRLDGIPLAIELAAARVSMFSTEQVAERLQESFHLLTTGNRAALPRHQTLQAAIDWSYNLLLPNEQSLFRRLSVFVNGWTLNAAESICSDANLRLRSEVVLSLLSQLINKSLVNMEETNSERRYHMLETIRQYALEKLTGSGEIDTLRNKHLGYYLKLTEIAEPHLQRAKQIKWLNQLDAERENIRASLEWANESDVEAGMYILGRLQRFWEMYDSREGSYWLSKLLQKPESYAYPRARAKALHVYAWILVDLQQFDTSLLSAQECLELYRALGDQQGEVDGLLRLAGASSDMAEKLNLAQQAYELAQALGDEQRQMGALWQLGWLNQINWFDYFNKAIGLARSLQDWRALCHFLSTTGSFLIGAGDIDTAQKYLRESETLYQTLNISKPPDDLLPAYGQIALIRGNFKEARAYFEEIARLSIEAGKRGNYFWARALLGFVALRENNLAEAHNIFAEIAKEFQKDKNTIGVVFTLEGMAELYVAVGKTEQAARLIGWADTTREEIGDMRPLIEQEDIDKIKEVCLVKMGKIAFSDALEEGKQMMVDEALDLALKTVKDW